MPSKNLGLSINVGEDDGQRGGGGPRSSTRNPGSTRFGRTPHTARDSTIPLTGARTSKKAVPQTARYRPSSETPELLRLPTSATHIERWLRKNLDLDKERANLAKLKPFRDALASWPEDSVDPGTGQRSVMGTHKLIAARQDAHMLHQVAEMYHMRFLSSRQNTGAEAELTAAQAAYASLGLTKFEICLEDYAKADSTLGIIRRLNHFRPPQIKLSSVDDVVASLDKLKDRYYVTRTLDNTKRLGNVGVDVMKLPFAEGGPPQNRDCTIPRQPTVPEVSIEDEEAHRAAEEEVYNQRYLDEMLALERTAEAPQKDSRQGRDTLSRGSSRQNFSGKISEYGAASGGLAVTLPGGLGIKGSLVKANGQDRGTQGGLEDGWGTRPKMRWSDIALERTLVRSSGREAPAEAPPRAPTADEGVYRSLAALVTPRRARMAQKGALEGVEQMSAFMSSSSMYSPERRRRVGVAGRM